jgi:hypothetical protein
MEKNAPKPVPQGNKKVLKGMVKLNSTKLMIKF